MDYEYKSIILTGGWDTRYLDKEQAAELNKWFEQGWEYVDGIAQCISSGAHSSSKGPVMIILRKKKESIQL